MQAASEASRANSLTVGGASVIVGVALFVFADVYGSSARLGYSPVADAISELIETGAPNKPILDLLIGSYHALVVPFAYGLFLATRNGYLSLFGSNLLALSGCFGVVLTALFPCDIGCQPVTVRGTAHIFIAVPMGFSILLAILMFSLRFSKLQGWAGFAIYSRLTALLGLILAVFTVSLAESDIVGLLERALTISYLQWYLVVGIALLRRGLRRS